MSVYVSRVGEGEECEFFFFLGLFFFFKRQVFFFFFFFFFFFAFINKTNKISDDFK
eukprot:NODE_37132_length_248_cov_1.008264.p2 GENE.NODE_37132_length_248_cov_1.008264~~NODE_37132_length_248_cov_1.008264.p2  ORF type:complete len:56 (+),score=3.66 NODE_37132_length_248_cov_1.008264:35-202(+)